MIPEGIIQKIKSLGELLRAGNKSACAEADALLPGLREMSSKPDAVMAEFLLNLARAKHHVDSDLLGSNQLLFEAEAYHDESGNRFLLADIYNLIGVNFTFLGDRMKARIYFSKGIDTVGELDETSSPAALSRKASMYYNVTNLYRTLELDETRERHLEQAFELFTRIGDKTGIARCYLLKGNRIGEKDRKNPERLEFYQKAYALFKEAEYRRGTATTLTNIGLFQAENGNYESGIQNALRGLLLVNMSGNNTFRSSAYNVLAYCYFLSGQYEKAERCYRKAEAMVLEMKSEYDLYLMYEEWANMLYAKGDYQRSFEYLKKANEYKEHVMMFDKYSKVDDARVLLELDEQKREAELLREKKDEVARYAKQLELSNYELKQFAHAAAHDLREPLRTITSYIQLLGKEVEGMENIDVQEYLDFIVEGSKRMKEVADSLVYLSNISPELFPEWVDPNEVVSELVNNLRTEHNYPSLVLELGEPQKVWFDPEQLERILNHILTNACKFNVQEAIQVKFSITNSNDGWVQLCMEDNGIGVPANYREKVFDIFQRLHQRNEYKGLGVGLTVCKKIVEQAGGKIWLDDSSLGGTRVCIRIPEGHDGHDVN